MIVSQLAQASATAPTPSLWKVQQSCDLGNKLTISTSAEIRRELADELKNLVKKCSGLQQLHLKLNSPGGSFYVAAEMIEDLQILKKSGVEIITEVINGDECDSMCVALYAQGDQRLAAPAAAFMFHGVATFSITNIPDPTITAQLIEILRKTPGLNQLWLDSLIADGVFSEPSMYWITGQELFSEKTGFATELTTRHQKLKPYDRSYRSF